MVGVTSVITMTQKTMYVNDAEWLRYDFIEGPNSGNQFRGTRIIVKPYDTIIDRQNPE